MDELLSSLNSAQRATVTSEADVLQVLAPPGSGKTKTLTARVSYLITSCGYEPCNMLICTFTVKAAREMRERIQSLVGDQMAKKLILGTFHSVARRFLVSYGHHIGLERNFGIADTSDSKAIIKRIVKDHQFLLDPDRALARISSQKAKGIDGEAYAAVAHKGLTEQEFAIIFREYETALKLSNLLDFDDLLLRCASLLRKYPRCVANIQAVLIDEFQDTNEVQFDLMNLFAQYKRTITIVGDPDQSIYGWRNAQIKNLDSMKTQYPDTLVQFLEENYRSSGAILDAAQAVIDQDVSRPPKRLRATHNHGSLPVLRRLPTAAVEARWLVDEIKRCIALSGDMLLSGDFAILLRSASVSRHIETALNNAGVPYRMVGGTKFYDRAEVKILLDYLRVINQPERDDAVLRIINVPPRGVGEVGVKNFLDESRRRRIPLWDILIASARGRLELAGKISGSCRKGVADFVNIISSCRDKMTLAGSRATLCDVLDHVLKRTRFEAYLQKKHADEFEARWANVSELRAQTADVVAATASGEDPYAEENLPTVAGAEQRTINETEDALTVFLGNIALANDMQKSDGAEDSQCVTISTIHAAKGLEWPVVFIPACYTGCIPHSRAEDHDEERRLLYVGMTRAQVMLYLSCPMKNSQAQDTTLSSFLSDGSVAAHFADQGPCLEYYAVSLLATALDRKCPHIATVEASRMRLARSLDDKWPADGSDLPGEGEGWRERNPSFGRERPNAPDVGPPTVLGGFVSAADVGPPSDGFSIRRNVRRGEYRQASVEQPLAYGAARRVDPLLRGRTTRKNAAERPIAAGIASYFGHPDVKSEKQDAVPTPANPGDPEPLREITPSISNRAPPARSFDCFSATATHRPRNLVSRRRPASPDRGETSDYVFLSSSPTRENEAEVKRRKIEDMTGRPVPAKKHAASFHVTTVAQLDKSRGGSGKTLGLGRAFVPWNARRHK